ncbi:MAG: hypothetical protein RLZZ387_5482 [Chloroflexota bacterium]
MDRVHELLLTDLRFLIADLGKDGGLMSPSIYDTAQVLRLAPPEDPRPALVWLIEQQQPDGGWGSPAVPRARDVPTLAALLALHTHGITKPLHHGLQFLHGQADLWGEPLPDDLPVGLELLLPRLLEEAAEIGMQAPHEQYAALIALGQRRRRMIAKLTLRPGTTPVHSWEALGVPPDPALIDATGGVGHSPAATAAWLRATATRRDLARERSGAQRYLEQAAHATGSDIPGVVPTAWPITRFEQSFALYALLLAGLLDHPALAGVVIPQLDDLAQAMTPRGIGFSDCFVPDGDDTAEAMAVLHAAGWPVSLDTLARFADADHYCAYPGELQPAVSVTAHAAHTLELFGRPSHQAQSYLIAHQLPDGRWAGDKWNGSWLYPTWRTLAALRHSPHEHAVLRGVQALVAHQRLDGGWGICGPNAEETSYAVLALRACLGHPALDATALAGLERGERWLTGHYQPFARSAQHCWIAKENYRPDRLARMIELVATFPRCAMAQRQFGAALPLRTPMVEYAKH